MPQSTPTPKRQIRAHYDSQTITLYQAYSDAIADAAVASQKLHASPLFSLDRMTWIKPSWTWMLYRSGYAAKDSNQVRILALKMRHSDFEELLRHACVHDGRAMTVEERKRPVRVQWDPERSVWLGPLPYRSIQIGVGRGIVRRWVEEWVIGIEDVTERARELKRRLDKRKEVTRDELVALGLVPEERAYEVPEELRETLRMDMS